MFLPFLCIVILLITIPSIIILYQAKHKPVVYNDTVCNNATTQPLQYKQDTNPNQQKESFSNKTHNPMIRDTNHVLGPLSKFEEASRIVSKIGYRRHQEPFQARYKFMKTILPAKKRSQHMIPIPEPPNL